MPNWGWPVREDWNLSSVNTIQVQKREFECVWCGMLKNFKG